MWREVMQAEPPPMIDPYTEVTTDHLMGRIWTRPGLTRRDRRLVTLTIAAVSGQGGPLRNHLRASLESGDLSPEWQVGVWDRISQLYLREVDARFAPVVDLRPSKDARLTLAALNHAVAHRRPRPGVIFHSDRGVEYAAYAFRGRLAALGFVQSMNRPREITDNAHMESFFHSMKSDAVHGLRFVHPVELVQLVRSYIPYYNGVRLHSGIGYFTHRL